MAPSATSLVGVHGFDLARDAVVELQVLVCKCVRSEVAQIVDSLRCVSEGAEHSSVNFPGFAVLTKALLNRTGLSALSIVEPLIKFLGCTDVVGVYLSLTLVGCTTRILPLVVLEVTKCLVVYKRDRAMQTILEPFFKKQLRKKKRGGKFSRMGRDQRWAGP
jgi:hypothetical protein